VIVNLAQLRKQRTSPPLTSGFDAGDPRRLRPLSLEQQKKRAKELCAMCARTKPAPSSVFAATARSPCPPTPARA